MQNDLFDINGKVAVVTGGTRGIGMMIARGLLQAGASVYISSRKPDAVSAAEAELCSDSGSINASSSPQRFFLPFATST
jgi:NAD(P)-dependent dehydrogenase (short-subunit alcohol dehydrogenase family)